MRAFFPIATLGNVQMGERKIEITWRKKGSMLIVQHLASRKMRTFWNCRNKQIAKGVRIARKTEFFFLNNAILCRVVMVWKRTYEISVVFDVNKCVRWAGHVFNLVRFYYIFWFCFPCKKIVSFFVPWYKFPLDKSAFSGAADGGGYNPK